MGAEGRLNGLSPAGNFLIGLTAEAELQEALSLLLNTRKLANREAASDLTQCQ